MPSGDAAKTLISGTRSPTTYGEGDNRYRYSLSTPVRPHLALLASISAKSMSAMPHSFTIGELSEVAIAVEFHIQSNDLPSEFL